MTLIDEWPQSAQMLAIFAIRISVHKRRTLFKEQFVARRGSATAPYILKHTKVCCPMCKLLK